MPVVELDRFERAELRARPDCLLVFGDNEQRRGLGGQANAFHDDPAVPASGPGSAGVGGGIRGARGAAEDAGELVVLNVSLSTDPT